VTTAEVYAEYRPLMFAISYRMLGRVTEAEDVVQEAFLRYHRAMQDAAVDPSTGPESPKAYLSAVTTRLCIDQLRSARHKREAYVGPWLPEPLLTGADPLAQAPQDPADLAEQADSLSMAFLVLLERLTAVERAAFLLHDVFGFGYPEIAAMIGRTEANSRQVTHRARQHLAGHSTRFEASREKRDELAARFIAAVGDGDVDGLVAMLAADVVVYGDSAGMRPSWPRPITGTRNVGTLFAALGTQLQSVAGQIRQAEVNGQPGALFLDSAGRLISVLLFDISESGRIAAIRSVISREKLRHLGPLADIDALRAAAADPG
jgi:RNA polymerase sigma-70 factor, ECF subfamily